MSKPSRILCSILVLLAIPALWILLGSDAERARDALSKASPGVETERASTQLDEPDSEPANREGFVEVETPEVVEPPQAPELEIVPYVTQTLRGSLTLFDEFENGPFLESGSFGFWIWQGQERSYHEVQVERGAWETVLSDTVRLSLADVELGGRVAAFNAEDGPPIEIPASGFLELEAFIPKPVSLHVVGHDTWEELDQVTIVVARNRMDRKEHPGEYGAEDLIAEKVTSPIELGAVSGVRIDTAVTYFAKAEGYSWDSLILDHSSGGERQLLLEPAGSLEVHLSEFEASLFPMFRLWRRRVLILERPLEWEREFTLEGIAAGEYVASVEVGRDLRSKYQLGSEKVKIHRGGTTVVELELVEGPVYERADLAGTLIVPKEWNLDSFRIIARLTDTVASRRESLAIATDVELANIPGRDDAWRFHFSELVCGTWKFGVEPTLFATTVRVEAGDTDELTITVPEPADWTVKAVDKFTGKPALLEELRFRWKGSYTDQASVAERGVGPGEFLIRAPLGRVLLTARGAGFRKRNQWVELDAAQGEIELEVASECGIHLTARSGGSPFEWPEGTHGAAYQPEGDGFSYGIQVTDEVLSIRVSEPGVYQVDLVPLEGYLPIKEATVVVEAAAFVQHEIELIGE